jgi:hypothetical protein
MSDTVENGSPGTVLSPFPFLELFGGKAKQAPGTFSSGKEIARFNRGADLVVFVGPISNDAFSLDLVFSPTSPIQVRKRELLVSLTS